MEVRFAVVSHFILIFVVSECTADQIRSFDAIGAPFECQVAFTRRSKIISAVNWLTVSAVFSPVFGYGCEIRRFDSSVSTSSIVVPEELLKDQFDARITAKWISDGTVQVNDATIDVPFHFAFIVEEKEVSYTKFFFNILLFPARILKYESNRSSSLHLGAYIRLEAHSRFWM